jgi:hypothetical protein
VFLFCGVHLPAHLLWLKAYSCVLSSQEREDYGRDRSSPRRHRGSASRDRSGEDRHYSRGRSPSAPRRHHRGSASRERSGKDRHDSRVRSPSAPRRHHRGSASRERSGKDRHDSRVRSPSSAKRHRASKERADNRRDETPARAESPKVEASSVAQCVQDDDPNPVKQVSLFHRKNIYCCAAPTSLLTLRLVFLGRGPGRRTVRHGVKRIGGRGRSGSRSEPCYGDYCI